MQTHSEKSFSELQSFLEQQNIQRNIPHFQRAGENPPGNFQNYAIVSIDDKRTLEIIAKENIDAAAKETLIGLLRWGNVMEFPGGVGLDYKAPFKTNYMPEYAQEASKKIGNEVYTLGANYILTPDIAALFWAADISSTDGRKPILRIQKDGKESPGDYKGALKSYTRGKDDLLYIDMSSLVAAVAKTQKKLRFFVTDEIADTGKMLELIATLIQHMQEDKLDVKIVGMGVIIEKTFTSARQLIEKDLRIPLLSALKIKDMWLHDNEGYSGIAIEGIERYAFRFSRNK